MRYITKENKRTDYSIFKYKRAGSRVSCDYFVPKKDTV